MNLWRLAQYFPQRCCEVESSLKWKYSRNDQALRQKFGTCIRFSTISCEMNPECSAKRLNIKYPANTDMTSYQFTWGHTSVQYSSKHSNSSGEMFGVSASAVATVRVGGVDPAEGAGQLRGQSWIHFAFCAKQKSGARSNSGVSSLFPGSS